jgi:hypothetical protein
MNDNSETETVCPAHLLRLRVKTATIEKKLDGFEGSNFFSDGIPDRHAGLRVRHLKEAASKNETLYTIQLA